MLCILHSHLILKLAVDWALVQAQELARVPVFGEFHSLCPILECLSLVVGQGTPNIHGITNIALKNRLLLLVPALPVIR